jgi:hypothetical protein
MLELDKVSSATFAAHQGSRFRICHGAEVLLEVELVQVTELRSPWREPPGDRRMPFSLVFRGPGTPSLVQHLFRVEHDRLGALELFLVPIGADDVGMRYEAVFN